MSAVTLSQTLTPAGRDWPYHQGDPGGTRFSTLTQINTNNVRNLKRAWTFNTGSGRFSSSPMVIDGIMYFSAPNGVYAVDGATGKQIWKFAPAPTAPAEGRGGARRSGSRTWRRRRRTRRRWGPGTVRPGGDGGRGGADAIGAGVRGPAYWRGTASRRRRDSTRRRRRDSRRLTPRRERSSRRSARTASCAAYEPTRRR